MLYLVRHGQTNWNLENRIQGQYNVPLNDTGRAQAHDMAKKLETFNIEQIVSSNLDRATETAQIIGNALKIHVDYDARLREYDFGQLTGRNRADIDTNMLVMFFMNPAKFEAEPLESAFARVSDFLNGTNFNKNILAVTHGGALNFVMCYLDNKNGTTAGAYINKCLHTKIHNASLLRLKNLNSYISVLKNTRFYRIR